MQDFFHNKNVGSAFIQRVPCCFAKPNKDGSMGTHYTAILLDNDNSLLYVGAECEKLHGEGIQAIQELGGETCFSVTEKFRQLLKMFKQPGFQGNTRNAIYVDLNPVSAAAYKLVAERFEQVSGKRRLIKAIHDELAEVSNKDQMLTRIANVVSSKICKIEGLVVENAVKTDIRYPKIWLVKNNNLILGNWEFARRGQDGNWTVLADMVKSWAQRNHSTSDIEYWLGKYGAKVVNYEGKKDGKLLNPSALVHLSQEWCIFCGAQYERMSMHTQGAKHQDRVLHVVNMITRATSRQGLKILNNPEYKHLFFKD